MKTEHITFLDENIEDIGLDEDTVKKIFYSDIPLSLKIQNIKIQNIPMGQSGVCSNCFFYELHHNQKTTTWCQFPSDCNLPVKYIIANPIVVILESL